MALARRFGLGLSVARLGGEPGAARGPSHLEKVFGGGRYGGERCSLRGLVKSSLFCCGFRRRFRSKLRLVALLAELLDELCRGRSGALVPKLRRERRTVRALWFTSDQLRENGLW